MKYMYIPWSPPKRLGYVDARKLLLKGGLTCKMVSWPEPHGEHYTKAAASSEILVHILFCRKLMN